MTNHSKEDITLESVKIRRNKCFKEDFAGFDRIKPINIIVGRNNSGKSVLLDMVEFLVKTKLPSHWEAEDTDGVNTILDGSREFLFTRILSENTLGQIFNPSSSGGGLSGNHWEHCGRYLLSSPIEFHVDSMLKPQSVSLLGSPFDSMYLRDDRRKEKHGKTACQYIANKIHRGFIPNALLNKTYRRLTAERDIVPEEQSNELFLGINGTGASNIIRAFLNDAKFDRDVIRVTLLEGLNKIFEPDNTFTEIVSRRIEVDKWEIFLNEEKKQILIPLSKSGSGLKTILLVLLNLLAIPKIPLNSPDTQNYIFAFEELENNLHPSLLRRLYRYIETFAEKEKSIFFITTHSNIVIDIFSQSDSAQIVHVTHDGIQAKTETVHHFTSQNAILDDLGVRASDLLQANGIVWLEGPSDRIYFNRWVEIFSNGSLREHRDYECAFYGGAVLSHYQAADPNDDGNFINIFRVNRNAILLADSDKTSKNDTLKTRVARMKHQIEQTRGIVWVFDAKEIENYIPSECIQKAFEIPEELPRIGKLRVFANYWKENKIPGIFDKVKLARKIAPLLTIESLASRFDLSEKMKTICDTITAWQSKSE